MKRSRSRRKRKADKIIRDSRGRIVGHLKTHDIVAQDSLSIIECGKTAPVPTLPMEIDIKESDRKRNVQSSISSQNIVAQESRSIIIPTPLIKESDRKRKVQSFNSLFSLIVFLIAT